MHAGDVRRFWRFSMNKRSMFSKMAMAGLVAAAALLGASSANAGPNWAIGVALPGISIGVGEPGHYRAAPYFAPAPAPYYRPAPPMYRPAPGYFGSQPVYYQPSRGWDERGYRGRWDGEHHDRREWDRRDYRGDWDGRR
jgi:hypothetical protein